MQLDTYLRGAPSTAATMQTESGVKDKYFQHFADKLAVACAQAKERQKIDSSINDNQYVVQILQDLRKSMPDGINILSPSLRLEGRYFFHHTNKNLQLRHHEIDFDPNTDSPVEILHVVLLGFVKYFWRDAVARQNKEGKEILKARINSFCTTGLGSTKPRGTTLVQYAGSLTGHDFRLVLQLAPAVLYGLLPERAYDAWVALCQLAPLVFQPEINDLSSYLVSIKF